MACYDPCKHTATNSTKTSQLAPETQTFDLSSQPEPRFKKPRGPRILSMSHPGWLIGLRNPYFMAYYNPYIFG